MICSGCGDPIDGTACCNNCIRGTFAVDSRLIQQVKDLYYKDDRKPVKIYKMTRVHPDATRKICYGKETA